MRNFIRATQNKRGFRKLHQRISPSGVELWRLTPGRADRSCCLRDSLFGPSRGSLRFHKNLPILWDGQAAIYTTITSFTEMCDTIAPIL